MQLPDAHSPHAKKLDLLAILGALLLPGGLLMGVGWLFIRWRSLAHPPAIPAIVPAIPHDPPPLDVAPAQRTFPA